MLSRTRVFNNKGLYSYSLKETGTVESDSPTHYSYNRFKFIKMSIEDSAATCSTETPKSKGSNPDPLTTRMNTLSTSTPTLTSHPPLHPPIQPLPTKDEILFEPLKICLDSGDDSSMGSSSCDDDFDDNDYFFGFTLAQSPDDQEQQRQDENDPCSSTSSFHDSPSCSFDYFHKQAHKSDNDTTTVCSASIASISNTDCTTSPVTATHQSVNSIPSLLGSSSHSSPQLSSSYSSTTSNKRAKLNHKNKRKGRVSLHKSVSVIPIPSRCEYSLQIRERLWSSSEELRTNAARNSVEFASEGWNWRNVIEDEHMLLHPPSGELIHPIHIHNACKLSGDDDNGDKGGRTAADTVDDEATLRVLAGLVPNTPLPATNKDVVTATQTSKQVQIPVSVSEFQ